MKEIEEIAKINLERVMRDKSLEICPICDGTTFTIVFLGITLCTYCRGKGVIKKQKGGKRENYRKII